MFNNNSGSMGPADFAALLGGNAMNGLGGEGGLLILIILFALFGWGGNGNGFGGNGRGGYPVYVGSGAGMGSGGIGGNELYPWLNQAQNQDRGFADISTQLCNGFGNVQMALSNGFSAAEASANARQMANMQQGFAMQTALLQGFGDSQLAMANQTATILAEHCADRNALQLGIRDVIASQVAGDQRIMDKLCQLELDGVKADREADRREIDNLRQQLTTARQESAFANLNANVQQGFANEVDALYNRLNNCPVPTTPVFGRTPIFTCGGQNPGCQCNGQQVLFG